jgi:phosphoglycerate dehydrogenase-like enzyme
MKILAGRDFHTSFGGDIPPGPRTIEWSLIEGDGSWSSGTEDAEMAVLVGDAYCPKFKEAVLDTPTVRWVHTENSGTDGPFYEEVLSRGILLSHSPACNAPEAAEFVMAAILWHCKRLEALRRQQESGLWKRIPLESLVGRTILIAGLGAVGSRVARIAKVFEMHVLGINRDGEQLADTDETGTLEELHAFLPRSDIIVLALPLNARTDGIIAAPELRVMKDDVLLVNVARGRLVDIGALKERLKTRPKMRALLDVMPVEPWPPDDELWHSPQLFLTPHVAWSSPNFRPRAAQIWHNNLRRYLDGRPLKYLVRASGSTSR